MKWLINVKDPSSRLARWNLALKEYDFEIIHKQGNAHSNVDTLSRIPIRQVSDLRPIYSKREIREAQINDFLWNRVRSIIKEEIDAEPDERFPDKLHTFFIDNDDVLYHIRTPERRREKWYQMVIPPIMVEYILKLIHDVPSSGHLGSRKMRQKLEMLFYWPTLRKDVQEYCGRCEKCNIRKRINARTQQPLQKLSELDAPFTRMGIDILGPLPVTNQGNKYVLVMVDHFSRYAECAALPDQKVQTIAKAFVDKIVLRHSPPKGLLSDRGANFLAQLMEEICKVLQIRCLYTSACHPATNGIVERFNKTLVDTIAHYVDKDQRNWDEWLPFALYAYNTVRIQYCMRTAQMDTIRLPLLASPPSFLFLVEIHITYLI